MKLSRRGLVKGGCAAVVALPLLESLGNADAFAQSATRPKRMVVMYGGVSTGTDRPAYSTAVGLDTVGRDYELVRSLTPLGTGTTAWGAAGQDVKNDVSVVTGLTIPWADRAGGPRPPGGRSVNFHYNTMGPQVSGVVGTDGESKAARGPSADQIAADVISEGRPHRSLVVCAQAGRYVSDGGTFDKQLSFRSEDGRIRAIEPIDSPRVAWRTLFSSFEPPSEADAAAARLAARSRRAALGLSSSRTRALLSQAGPRDRASLEQFLEQREALRARITELTETPASPRCIAPDEPPELATGGRYSGEQERTLLMCDLAHMAFACDLTRVASIRLTRDQCFMHMAEPAMVNEVAHQTTHNGNLGMISDVVAWHVWHFARFVRKLRDTREPDGTTMLDNTCVVLLFEGGFGYDPETRAARAAHSTENMVALIAGRVGGLMPGQHVRATGRHPASVMISALTALGLDDRLGDITGRIDELFR